MVRVDENYRVSADPGYRVCLFIGDLFYLNRRGSIMTDRARIFEKYKTDGNIRSYMINPLRGLKENMLVVLEATGATCPCADRCGSTLWKVISPTKEELNA